MTKLEIPTPIAIKGNLTKRARGTNTIAHQVVEKLRGTNKEKGIPVTDSKMLTLIRNSGRQFQGVEVDSGANEHGQRFIWAAKPIPAVLVRVPAKAKSQPTPAKSAKA